MVEKEKKVVKKKKKVVEKKVEVAVPLAPRIDPLIAYEERRKQQEEEDNKRIKERKENKIREEEAKVDKLRMQIRRQCKSMVIVKPPPYKPLEPVKKSSKLAEYEDLIARGTFFDDDNTKRILEDVRQTSRKVKLMEKLMAHGIDGNSPIFGRV